MAANPRDLLIRPIITEKTSQMMQENKYTFQVPLEANKVEIRQAVEAVFGVKVLNVNTIRYSTKCTTGKALRPSETLFQTAFFCYKPLDRLHKIT